MKKNPSKIEITEMFMAQADKDRCFYGIITRNKDEQGNRVLFSRILVRKYGFNEELYSRACDPSLNERELQDKLGKQLDEMVLFVLDYGLTKIEPVVEKHGALCINLN